MSDRSDSRKSSQGFTLIELSIVLVILGLIMSTVVPLIISMTKKNKLTQGKKVVAIARDELLGSVITTRQVPANLSGVGHDTDPWKNKLVYVPAAGMLAGDVCSWLAAGTNNTGLAVCTDGDCSGKKHANVAFVIASMGPNFNRQMEAATNHDGNTADNEIRLYSYGTTLDQYTIGSDPNRSTDQFDDIIDYVTVDQLIPLLHCSVTVQNQTGETLCVGGAGVLDGVDLVTIEYNNFFGFGSTPDDCATITATCSIDYNAAMAADINKDGRVQLTAVPPACGGNIVDL